MRKILVIDDEESIRELIRFNLEMAGFSVELAADGREGLDRLDDTTDLVILDLMLPVIDGLTVCREIRSHSEYRDLPIIMLTARGEEIDRVLGLEMGADDYITKPFSPRELIARIKAILRRVANDKNLPEGDEENNEIVWGDLVLNIASHEVRRAGNLIDLAPKEFELLKLLLLNKGKVMTRELLLEKIWGYEYDGDTRTVDVHIRRLRQKIGEEYVTTVRGVGYKIAELE